MSRALVNAVAALMGWTASACPVFDDTYCSFDADCAPGLYCDTESGVCFSATVECAKPLDCSAPNETCGADGFCHVGDCYFHGCVSGYHCIAEDTGYQCVERSNEEGGAGGSRAREGAGTAGVEENATSGHGGEAGQSTAAD